MLCWLLFCICCSSSQHIFAPLSLVAVYSPRMPPWLSCSRPSLFSGAVHTPLLSNLSGLAWVAITCLQPVTVLFTASSSSEITMYFTVSWRRLSKKVLSGFVPLLFYLENCCFTCSWKASCFLPWIPVVAALWQCRENSFGVWLFYRLAVACASVSCLRLFPFPFIL